MNVNKIISVENWLKTKKKIILRDEIQYNNKGEKIIMKNIIS